MDGNNKIVLGRLINKKFSSDEEYKNPIPEGTILNTKGKNPVWIDPSSDEIKPIDKFKVDEPDKEFKEEMKMIPNDSERALKNQMKSIEHGYATENTPGFNKENTHYLNDFQPNESGLPYSKTLDVKNRFTYAIHKPKKEGSKYVSHVEPIDCFEHKWRGVNYGHNKSGLHPLSDENLKKLKSLNLGYRKGLFG